MSIAKWMPGESPRDKLLSRGSDALSDAELLALLLATGTRGCSAVDLARDLLERFDGLAGALHADTVQLQSLQGMGEAKVALLRACVELGRRQALYDTKEKEVLTNPETARVFLQHHLGGRAREVFSCIFLDSQHQLICCEDLFMGTLDGAAVYPREVAVRALQYRAAAVILAHNHPSGVVQPSDSDKRITTRLREALNLLDIRVLDHVIIGRGQPYSFAEEGLI